MRLFVSVDLPEALIDPVREVQTAFADADGLDFVDPAQAHLTLKFLGDVEEADYDDVVAALTDAVADADVGPFEVSFEGLGVFPSLDYVSVVWLGVGDGSAELAALHEAIEEACVALGFDAEDRAFTPHVTLARMRDARGKALVTRLVEERHPEVGTARVEAVRLTESTLTDDGPVYETRERFALDGDA